MSCVTPLGRDFEKVSIQTQSQNPTINTNLHEVLKFDMPARLTEVNLYRSSKD
jgi:hypothetical protein